MLNDDLRMRITITVVAHSIQFVPDIRDQRSDALAWRAVTLYIASQPGHSEKWPGTDCLRMRVISVIFSVKKYPILTSFHANQVYGMLHEPRIRPVATRVCL